MKKIGCYYVIEPTKTFSLDEIPVNTVPRHVDRIKDFYNNNEEVVLKGNYRDDSLGVEFNKI